MLLDKYKEDSKKYTEKASEIARQINFAGIGIIWIITSEKGIIIKDSLFIYPLFIITLSLLFDFFQYFLGGIIWITFYNNKKKEGLPINQDITSKPWRKRIIYSFYYIKFALTLAGYIFMAIALLTYF